MKTLLEKLNITHHRPDFSYHSKAHKTLENKKRGEKG